MRCVQAGKYGLHIAPAEAGGGGDGAAEDAAPAMSMEKFEIPASLKQRVVQVGQRTTPLLSVLPAVLTAMLRCTC